MARENIYTVLQSTQLPCDYSHFNTDQKPPYLVYIGAGQTVERADNTHYWHENTYQVEYYYKTKDETNEAAIEAALLAGGYQFEKSEDNYLEDENVFVIYYYTN